ncbi:Serine/threonine-protein kinase RsbT [Azospirillaceae bacterium]
MTKHISNESIVVPILCDADVIIARKAGRDIAAAVGLGLADQTRLATAISELARNVVLYAKSGRCRVQGNTDGEWRSVTVVVEDNGPGIPDIGKAMTHGYSTSGGLGAGLPGTKRLVNEFSLTSHPGLTVIEITIRRRQS